MVIAGDCNCKYSARSRFYMTFMQFIRLLLISWLALTERDSPVAVSHRPTVLTMALIAHGLIMYFVAGMDFCFLDLWFFLVLKKAENSIFCKLWFFVVF